MLLIWFDICKLYSKSDLKSIRLVIQTDLSI